jgi:hypothetical protein
VLEPGGGLDESGKGLGLLLSNPPSTRCKVSPRSISGGVSNKGVARLEVRHGSAGAQSKELRQ